MRQILVQRMIYILPKLGREQLAGAVEVVCSIYVARQTGTEGRVPY